MHVNIKLLTSTVPISDAQGLQFEDSFLSSKNKLDAANQNGANIANVDLSKFPGHVALISEFCR